MRIWQPLTAAATALTAAATLTLTPSCLGTMCTAIYVPHGLMVDIEGELIDGDYAMRVRADGRDLMLDLNTSLVDPGCGDGISPCRDELDAMYAEVWVSRTVQIAYVDEARGGPATVELELLRDGVVVASGTFTPDYQVDEPNGNGCGEVVHARETLTVVAAP